MTGSRIGRREFLQRTTAVGTLACLSWPRVPALAFASSATLAATGPYPVRFRKQNPYEPLRRFIDPGQDEFGLEKTAVEITTSLEQMVVTRSLPLAEGFSGNPPRPERLEPVGERVFEAVFGAAPSDFASGLRQWLGEIGEIRKSRFFVTGIQTGNGGEVDVEVRYEISSRSLAGLEYRVGQWNQVWRDGRLLRFAPIAETVARSARPLFTEVTARAFAGVDSFESQLLKGVPYWRARLDSASGIDVYGTNGVAVGDIDNDGWDEIYVCQPGGLPDRLYKNRGDGTFDDITARAGLGVLDKTSSALFVDLRNAGRQDLVVLRSSGPLLFLNDGSGRFSLQADAFRFAHPPQGTFTSMAAVDYDRDGRLDLYLCCYHYFQSEDQYRYPVPYHDARNGPPNFLFRNRLTASGGGFFDDVTGETGLGVNNDRYSFAAAWCDYDGDGWPDLYVANDFGRNNLYKNEGGRFRDVAAEAGVEDIGPGMSAAWFDYDGDGLPDLYVANMWTAVGQRLVRQQSFSPASTEALKVAYDRHSKGNSLYRNRGDGTFEETGAAQNVEMGRWGWSADGVDFDNDGVPEIYATAGMLTGGSTGSPDKDLEGFFWRQVVARTPAAATAATVYETGWNALNQWIREGYSWSGREPNILYARRNGRHYDLSGISGLDVADDSRAFAVTDFDGDGRLDLVLKSRLGPQLRLFQNDSGATCRSLAVRLVGATSNRDGIGARVEVRADSRTITRWLQAGSGFLSQHTKALYFGLDQATVVGAIVHWPSGQRQEFAGLEAGFIYTLTEGSAEITRRPFQSGATASSSQSHTEALSGDNSLALSPTWLLEPIPLPDDRKAPAFLCFTAGPVAAAPTGVPFQVIDLSREPPDVAALYAVFRRYLFDWRSELFLPMVLLVDASGLCQKVYPGIPNGQTLAEDLRRLRDSMDGRIPRQDLALPSPGRYYSPPARKFFQMGTAFYWAGYPEAALRYLEAEVRQSPSNFKALLGIGQIHLEAERYAQAREYLERAQVLNDRSAALWNNLGGVEAGEGHLQKAIACYERALSLEPDLAHVLANAGQVYARFGDDQAAEEKLRRALQIEPADADAANQLGLVLARQNRNDEARQWFQRAIASKRNHADAINNLGVVYAQTGMLNDALATFRYGIEVAPEGRDLYINLARVYVSMGDVDKARDVVRQFLARKPGDPLALKALEELKAR